jgi:Leucine-rich repeat (LRR) protein
LTARASSLAQPLSVCRIQQLTDLQLPKLQQLDISGNEVSELKALTGIPSLRVLSATGCHLEVSFNLVVNGMVDC